MKVIWPRCRRLSASLLASAGGVAFGMEDGLILPARIRCRGDDD